MEKELNSYIMYMSEVKNASPNTIMSYKTDLLKFLHYLKDQDICSFDRINETCVNSYILGLEKEGRSPATVSRNIAVLRSFFLYLIKHGQMKEDPMERIRPPKVEKKMPKALSMQEMELLLAQPDKSTKKGLRDSAMLELLYATGIRVTELINLRVEDVNLKNSYIVCIGENNHKSRLVPFGRIASSTLGEYLTSGRKELLKSCESDILFPNVNGNQMTRQGFWKLIKEYAVKAEIKQEITPQILRHTFAMHLVSNGADLRSVQELLGHADITTTQLYSKTCNAKVRDVYINSHPRA